MKKLIVMIMVIALVVSVLPVSSTAATQNVSFVIDGVPFITPAGEPEPYVNKDDRTMVSIRFFANAIGIPNSDIKWDNKTRTATIKRDLNTAEITVGNEILKVNGVKVTMDTKAEIYKERLFIPVRFVVEALGVYLEWNGAKRQIIINSKDISEQKPVFTYNLPTDEEFIAKIKSYCGTIDPCVMQDGILYPIGSKIGPNGDPILLTNYGSSYVLQDGIFLFDRSKNGLGEPDYTLKETINPDINRQIKDATKVLLDDNHYVDLTYNDGDEAVSSNIFLSLSKGAAYARNGYHYFKFVFYEEIGYNHKSDSNNAHSSFSENVYLSLTLGSLWEGRPNKDWTDPFYANKLKSALIAIFGKSNGENIFKYVLDHYQNKRINGQESYENIKEVKKFNNIQVDFGGTQGADLKFFFSYVN